MRARISSYMRIAGPLERSLKYNLITLFSKKIFSPWPRIQERLELFPGLFEILRVLRDIDFAVPRFNNVRYVIRSLFCFSLYLLLKLAKQKPASEE